MPLQYNRREVSTLIRGQVNSAICLQKCQAMSGTDIPYGATSLFATLALLMPGTLAPTSKSNAKRRNLLPICARNVFDFGMYIVAAYKMASTSTDYAARCPV